MRFRGESRRGAPGCMLVSRPIPLTGNGVVQRYGELMAFCPRCGTSVDGRFCAKCGTPMDAPPPQQQAYPQQPQQQYAPPQQPGYAPPPPGYQQPGYQQPGFQQPGYP